MILAASAPVKLYLQYFVVACLSGFYCQFGLCSPFSDGFKKNIFSQFAQNFSFLLFSFSGNQSLPSQLLPVPVTLIRPGH